ncbi:hypothetical protein BH11PSE8_BH11PSE8_17650 [soil metagenome]
MQPDTILSNETSPSVTIILPTIGRPDYVANTIRSLLLQDYGSFDILISDNAPKTPTRTVLASENISDPRISIIERTVRLPFSLHMNACIAAATGEYIMIVSDDDQLSPGYITEMVRCVTTDPQVSVCIGQQKLISESDKGLVPADGFDKPGDCFEGAQFLKDSLSGRLQQNIVTYISLFARKSDIVDIGGFKEYPDGSHADNYILVNLALRGKVSIGATLMLYRVYLASAGLSTPFSNLLTATQQYSADCKLAIDNSPSISRNDRNHINKLLKRSNCAMLVSRLRTVYARKLNLAERVKCSLLVWQFRIMPVHYPR